MRALFWWSVVMSLWQQSMAAAHAKVKMEEIDERLKPVDLTARNFHEYIGDGNVWLIEFYSPHCVHCIDFAPTYEDIARTYHDPESKAGIRVGKVNA